MNLLTFDIEDWYQGFKYRGLNLPFNVQYSEEKNIELILEILGQNDTKATFFVLGSFAQKRKEIIKRIHSYGHEIASHSFDHIVITKLSPNEFSEDLKKSTDILSDITGEKIIGFRAPKWSINKNNIWAFEMLAEAGFEYDSSIFPSNFHAFGSSKFSEVPFRIELENGLKIIEFPAQISFKGIFKMPIGGGFYFRAFPFFITKKLLKYSSRRKNYSMVYLHPYEFDKHTAQIHVNLMFKIVRYYNLSRTQEYLVKLLSELTFSSIRNSLGSNQFRSIKLNEL